MLSDEGIIYPGIILVDSKYEKTMENGPLSKRHGYPGSYWVLKKIRIQFGTKKREESFGKN